MMQRMRIAMKTTMKLNISTLATKLKASFDYYFDSLPL